MTTVREQLAADFLAEGVDAVFGLMGDGNMAWMATMAEQPGVTVVHARYEGAAVAMADGHARVTGDVAVASVTCGPGTTQVVTSLTAATRRRSPLVVLAGDTPVSAAYHLQALDAGPVVRSSGAAFVRVATPGQAAGAVSRVCHQARTERRPVVLAVPYDVQELPAVAPPPARPLPAPADVRAPLPDPRDVAAVAQLLAQAHRPLLLVGAGAVAADCRAAVLELAGRVGAPVATTLHAKGWLDGEPADLGVAGGFADDRTRAVCADADLVLALGARLAHHTTDGGTAWPRATVVQVSLEPQAVVDGARVADLLVRGDAGALLRAVLDQPSLAGAGGPAPADRAGPSPVPAQTEAPAPAPAPAPANGTMHPGEVAAVLDRAVPAELPVVVGVGHFWGFTVPALRGRHPSRYHFTHDFGVIGQALPTGMGVCVAEACPTVVVEGDGSLLMNVQELESLARHRLPVLVVVVDDGAYGAEFHKLPVTGADPELAVFGWVALDEVARAFGLQASRPATATELADAIAAFAADPVPTLLDVRVDVAARSPQFGRRLRS